MPLNTPRELLILLDRVYHRVTPQQLFHSENLATLYLKLQKTLLNCHQDKHEGFTFEDLGQMVFLLKTHTSSMFALCTHEQIWKIVLTVSFPVVPMCPLIYSENSAL